MADVVEPPELKTEFVGCYIRKSEKEQLEAMTEYLSVVDYIEKPYTSEAIRFALNLLHSFIRNELGEIQGQ